MAKTEDLWLGPGAAARRLGVTPKALRVYEREGLVIPARTEAGWRVYGPEHLARLHLVVVMRDLGVPLKAVRSLIRQPSPGLSAVLAVQQEALEAKRRRLDRAIGLLTDLRRRLASGGAVSVDDLANLSRETVMHTDSESADAKRKLTALFEERVGKETVASMRAQAAEHLLEIGKSKEDIVAEVQILLREARAHMAVGDPNAEPARATVRRWLTLMAKMPRPDEAVKTSLQGALREAMADPAIGPGLPFDADVVMFIRDVAKGLRAAGEAA